MKKIKPYLLGLLMALATFAIISLFCLLTAFMMQVLHTVGLAIVFIILLLALGWVFSLDFKKG